MRASSVNYAILKALRDRGDHLTAAEVYGQIRQDFTAVNPSTVYRSLERLVKAGQVSVSHMGGGQAVYELVGERQHGHLVCQECGAESPLDEALVSRMFEGIEANSGYRVTTNHLVLFGVCPECREKKLV